MPVAKVERATEQTGALEKAWSKVVRLGHFLDIGHGSEFGSVVLEVMDGIIL